MAIENILKSLKKIRISKEYFEKYPEVKLKLNYAMVRFVKSELGFKIKQDDPNAFFTAKYIPEKEQLTLHVRTPMRDEWNNITEFLDIDLYFPKEMMQEIEKLLTGSAIQ